MLLNLTVENFILIQNLELELSGGFTCISGETGAGKSILVGALGLILGLRADSQVLMDKSKKCIVEGTFTLDGYGLEDTFEASDLDYESVSIFRREINPLGKSRAFINDTPVNLTVMKEIGEKLLDIHSQNQTLDLNGAAFQLAMIDSYAGISSELKRYEILYKQYLVVQKQLAAYIEQEKKSNADREYFEFQLEELTKAELIPGEAEEFETELELLNHSEEIKVRLFSSLNLLDNEDNSILSRLSEARQTIEQASRYTGKLESINERISGCLIELKELTSELRNLSEHIQHDPDRIMFITQRLDLIYNLMQKHKVKEIEELIKLREQYASGISEIESIGDRIEKLTAELKSLEKDLAEVSQVLHEKRLKVFPGIVTEMEVLLNELGMPAAKFHIDNKVIDHYTATGKDKVSFMFAANKGSELKEVQKVASGGELSRLMLAIKSLVVKRSLLPTILFDEIDSGVSGEIAGKIGNIMRKMSANMQVVAITHLPQIAGKAHHHLLAYKEHGEVNTISNLRKLSDEERVNEIARMLSDETITDTARAAAKELMIN
ncbi:MAG: DNA repair protein RecN [Bacteroidales bacterium]|nr:DNA repair protein RecN [Bacteroidales bacterium]